MSASVLTNTSAMIALQTLRATNSNLNEVNNQISTGKKVATAKDSAAVFAITKVMSSDVAGFQAITESLSLGQATLGVASNAAQQVGLLQPGMYLLQAGRTFRVSSRIVQQKSFIHIQQCHLRSLEMTAGGRNLRLSWRLVTRGRI